MKLTIFGATGGTGKCLVEQALSAGHEVTAVVRDPARLTVPSLAVPTGTVPAGSVPAGTVPSGSGPSGSGPWGSGPYGTPSSEGLPAGLRAVTADVMDPAAITAAVTGADAVLSAVGPHGSGPTTVSRDAHRSIIAAMRNAGARRLLVVSGSVAADEGESPYLRYLLKPLVRAAFLRHVCADMRAAEEQIRASGLDWTIFRPPSLTDKPARGSYRTAVDRNLPHGFTVSRADLAACMLGRIGDPAAVHHHIALAN
jgi:putative NADH-flavin reductase